MSFLLQDVIGESMDDRLQLWLPQKCLGQISRRYSPWRPILQQNHTRVYRFNFENVSIVATFHQNIITTFWPIYNVP